MGDDLASAKRITYQGGGSRSREIVAFESIIEIEGSVNWETPRYLK